MTPLSWPCLHLLPPQLNTALCTRMQARQHVQMLYRDDKSRSLRRSGRVATKAPRI